MSNFSLKVKKKSQNLLIPIFIYTCQKSDTWNSVRVGEQKWLSNPQKRLYSLFWIINILIQYKYVYLHIKCESVLIKLWPYQIDHPSSHPLVAVNYIYTCQMVNGNGTALYRGVNCVKFDRNATRVYTSWEILYSSTVFVYFRIKLHETGIVGILMITAPIHPIPSPYYSIYKEDVCMI